MKNFKKAIIISIVFLLVGMLGGIHVFESTEKTYNNLEQGREQIALFIQDEDGKYNYSEAKKFPTQGYVLNLEKSTCRSGSVLSQDSNTKKISIKVQRSDQCTLFFDKLPFEGPTLKDYFDSVPKKEYKPDFATPATTDETAGGLYGLEDDYGMSYYFRGATLNNYVKFGKLSLDIPKYVVGYNSYSQASVKYNSLEECKNATENNFNCTEIDSAGQDMWWRIIRFNGDGSMRIQYDGSGIAGTNSHIKDFALMNQQWNAFQNDNKYVGWMFGGENDVASTSKEEAQRNETDSLIKTKVDEWYKKNFADTKYTRYIADRIFCNDRSIPGKKISQWSVDTGEGFAQKITAYGNFGRSRTGNNDFYVRKRANPQPTFICPQDNDKFTVEMASGGNGALTYPVGLITADEISAAGGEYSEANRDFYLNKGNEYWSFSPNYYYEGAKINTVYGVISSLNDEFVANRLAHVSPVINIKAGYLNQFGGSGTIDDPYYLIEDSLE